MQRHKFANHPAVSGLTYGFQELHIAGQRVLVQPGDMLHFTTGFYLVPEQDLGLYVAYNRGRVSDAPIELLHAFLTRYFPSPLWMQPVPATITNSNFNRFAGSYVSTRRNETSLEKLKQFFSPVLVRVAEHGRLHISGLAVVPNSLWIETGPGVFRNQFNPEIVAFREDAAGVVTHLFEGNFPIVGNTRTLRFGRSLCNWFPRSAVGIHIEGNSGTSMHYRAGAW